MQTRRKRYTGLILGPLLFICIIILIAKGTSLQNGTEGVAATSCHVAALCWEAVYTRVSKIAPTLALTECLASRDREAQIVVSAEMGNYRVQRSRK